MIERAFAPGSNSRTPFPLPFAGIARICSKTAFLRVLHTGMRLALPPRDIATSRTRMSGTVGLFRDPETQTRLVADPDPALRCKCDRHMDRVLPYVPRVGRVNGNKPPGQFDVTLFLDNPRPSDVPDNR